MHQVGRRDVGVFALGVEGLGGGRGLCVCDGRAVGCGGCAEGKRQGGVVAGLRVTNQQTQQQRFPAREGGTAQERGTWLGPSPYKGCYRIDTARVAARGLE